MCCVGLTLSFFRPFDYSELSVLFMKSVRDYLGFVTWHIIPLDAALRGVHSGKKWMDVITNNTQTGHHL